MKEYTLKQIYYRLQIIQFQITDGRSVSIDQFKVLVRRKWNLILILKRNMDFTPSEYSQILTLKELL